ncbi:MAG: hypothetical protein JXA43_01120 [Candidatus Diapherotrites archaeon]|nr:hypothetical protein [Candidatus Diapherotrites archaeon]
MHSRPFDYDIGDAVSLPKEHIQIPSEMMPKEEILFPVFTPEDRARENASNWLMAQQHALEEGNMARTTDEFKFQGSIVGPRDSFIPESELTDSYKEFRQQINNQGAPNKQAVVKLSQENTNSDVLMSTEEAIKFIQRRFEQEESLRLQPNRQFELLDKGYVGSEPIKAQVPKTKKKNTEPKNLLETFEYPQIPKFKSEIEPMLGGKIDISEVTKHYLNNSKTINIPFSSSSVSLDPKKYSAPEVFPSDATGFRIEERFDMSHGEPHINFDYVLETKAGDVDVGRIKGMKHSTGIGFSTEQLTGETKVEPPKKKEGIRPVVEEPKTILDKLANLFFCYYD